MYHCTLYSLYQMFCYLLIVEQAYKSVYIKPVTIDGLQVIVCKIEMN